ncbi:hypothetical protein GCM10009795_001070 [Nocardioides hankookensis]|uniref:Ig-like domain-containing protein n=1 Tax=Nocardioides hankookensis TaxID=443157 RepID=A0ABW1LL32_9ACTN
MKALAGRLLCLALISAGLGTATLATLEPASAAGGDSPTAIAVGPSGVSYVGFASGGRLLRLNPRGGANGTVPLDQDDPVDGLFVNASGQVWVDYGTSASLLAPGGRVLRHFSHGSGASCAGSPGSAYGGITVGGGRVWVAERCDGTMSVYSVTGRLLAAVDLPGRDHPRGITYGVAQSGRPDTVYVAMPDTGRIVAYRAGQVRSSSRPARTVTLRRPGGGVRPRPGGIAVDRFGQLTVADVANNAVYLVDTNHDYDLWRMLGHPPSASREAGRLRAPSAVSQYAQDGGGLSGNLFIADAGNQRVQRWNTSGWTYWVKQVRAGRGSGGSDDGGDNGGDNGSGTSPGDDDGGDDGGDGGDDGGSVGTGGPVSSSGPRVVGTAVVGETLTCNPGTWYSTAGPLAGSIRFAYRWTRGGATIAGAGSPTYVLVAADAGASVACEVAATDNVATTTAAAPAVLVAGRSVGPVDPDPDEPGPPVNTGAPTVTGPGTVGSALTCTPGSWAGGDLAYAYAWSRDGVAVEHSASAKYVVLSVDAGTSLSCTVTATDDDGSASASSAQRPVASSPVGAPVNLTSPTISGNPVAGQTLTCDPGGWSGSPTTVMAVWQRDGATVANGSWTYVVGAGAGDAALQCVVVAGNGSGLGAARSRPAAADACVGATGVEIDGGAAQTRSTAVTLTLRAPRGTTTVHVSNDPGFAGETVTAYPAGCTLAWTMPSIAGMPLSWSVYVRYDGSATTYSDSIVVDVPS